MHPESDFTKPSPGCLNPPLWSSPDDQASEVEVGEFLFGLVRLIKPRLVLETGCYLGYTTELLARGINLNGFGWLHACDLDEQACQLTEVRLQPYENVKVHRCSGLDLCSKFDWVDLAFLDSAPGLGRLEEAKVLKLNPGALVVVHDAWHQVATEIQLKLRWKQFFFPTPRGLSIYATR